MLQCRGYQGWKNMWRAIFWRPTEGGPPEMHVKGRHDTDMLGRRRRLRRGNAAVFDDDAVGDDHRAPFSLIMAAYVMDAIPGAKISKAR